MPSCWRPDLNLYRMKIKTENANVCRFGGFYLKTKHKIFVKLKHEIKIVSFYIKHSSHYFDFVLLIAVTSLKHYSTILGHRRHSYSIQEPGHRQGSFTFNNRRLVAATG